MRRMINSLRIGELAEVVLRAGSSKQAHEEICRVEPADNHDNNKENTNLYISEYTGRYHEGTGSSSSESRHK